MRPINRTMDTGATGISRLRASGHGAYPDKERLAEDAFVATVGCLWKGVTVVASTA